ncbi:MAG: hypothetical protein NTV63_01465 [Candidatus Woesearchaeota archaeon]|nr:hypothetical protein [Candidatus Woesearchaeota archaeon]
MDKKFFGLVMAAMLVLMIVPVKANSIGTGITIGMETEQFKPLIWMCGSRVLFDDNLEPADLNMQQRITNYAFTGEQIHWDVLVMDKNGIEKVKDVYVAVGEQGSEDFIEANCARDELATSVRDCNARIGEEELEEFDPLTMGAYHCVFTVEPTMHGEFWVHATVVDLDDQATTVDEDEYWFFNPAINLKITGELNFGVVRPGTMSYSPTLLVGNDAELLSGVLLDMFISGTDFYDPAHSGAKCPTTNQLELQGDKDDGIYNFAYYAVNGAYSTVSSDENYVPIQYGDSFVEFPGTMAGKEIIVSGNQYGGYYLGNVLTPGSEMSLTFRLALPEPCNGDFTDGNIFFWGEAI